MQGVNSNQVLLLEIGRIESRLKGDFNMSITSSKQPKKHAVLDFLLVFLTLILVLAALTPSNSKLYNSILTSLGTLDLINASQSAGGISSFASDLQYWNANCNHGWSSDSMCDEIVARSQSCAISTDSVYCSEYESYLQQFRLKDTQRINL